MALHRLLEGLVELLSAAFEKSDHVFQISLYIRIPTAVQSVSLHRQEIHDLAPTGQQGLQRALRCISGHLGFGLQGLSKPSQEHSIHPVCFCVLAECTGEMTDLTWIQDGHRQPGIMQGQHGGLFQAAGRFEHDQLGLNIRETN
ncbi:hypothetical protein DESA109040_23015 [Deinococcus saxicola]